VAPPRLAGLTALTLETAPAVCHDCVWWQSRGFRNADKERWAERVEDQWGSWGTIYRDDDGRPLGQIQYGPAQLFPRAAALPAGPPSDDAVLVTCAYLVGDAAPWVLQSLFLAAIGESRDRKAGALESFAYRSPAGHVELARLELGGLQPVEEGRRERVLRLVKDAFAPAPVPQRP
jgi:hypothetical protein